jgi:hypothetical protein
VVNFIPGEELETQVPTEHEAWWAPGSPGSFKEEKNFCFLLGFEPGSIGEQPRHYTDSTATGYGVVVLGIESRWR